MIVLHTSTASINYITNYGSTYNVIAFLENIEQICIRMAPVGSLFMSNTVWLVVIDDDEIHIILGEPRDQLLQPLTQRGRVRVITHVGGRPSTFEWHLDGWGEDRMASKRWFNPIGVQQSFTSNRLHCFLLQVNVQTLQ